MTIDTATFKKLPPDQIQRVIDPPKLRVKRPPPTFQELQERRAGLRDRHAKLSQRIEKLFARITKLSREKDRRITARVVVERRMKLLDMKMSAMKGAK